MPDIATALKQEISRIARKELRSSTGGSQKTITILRRQISEMRRRMDAMEKELARLRRGPGKTAPKAAEEESSTALRFRPAGFKAHRERLGLSAKDVGALLGASALSVYKWENGKARPREKHLKAIAQLRTMGKREALKLLEQLQD